LKTEEKNIVTKECDCKQTSVADIYSAVDEVIAITGGEKEKVIEILQEVQKRLNYLPSEALKHICKVTDITMVRSREYQLSIPSSVICLLENIL